MTVAARLGASLSAGILIAIALGVTTGLTGCASRARGGRAHTPTVANTNPAETTPATILLRVQAIQMESVPLDHDAATNLSFEVLNDGPTAVTDITLVVSIVQARSSVPAPAPMLVLRGPFSISAKVPLQPGYTMRYDMELSNISAETCACAATVDIVSARAISQKNFL
jgi:hypothetical protein